MKSMINKTEHFIKRLRWKAFLANSESPHSKQAETYGLKSERTPSKI